MSTVVRAMRKVILRADHSRRGSRAKWLPGSMRKQRDAAELMTQTREALDRVEDQVVYGGIIFLNAEQIGSLPGEEDASIHSGPLPEMEYFRWPLSPAARLAARVVRKLISPFIRRQERFNLDLLEALQRMEDRLETQQYVARQLRHRIAELEERLGNWE